MLMRHLVCVSLIFLSIFQAHVAAADEFATHLRRKISSTICPPTVSLCQEERRKKKSELISRLRDKLKQQERATADRLRKTQELLVAKQAKTAGIILYVWCLPLPLPFLPLTFPSLSFISSLPLPRASAHISPYVRLSLALPRPFPPRGTPPLLFTLTPFSASSGACGRKAPIRIIQKFHAWAYQVMERLTRTG